MDYDRAIEAAQWINARVSGPIGTGIVLGSGLGGLVDQLANPLVVSYAEIPHMPTPTVSGHQGRLVIGTLSGQRVAMFQGRFHTYEGYAINEVTFPVRILQLLHARRVILTAATGGIREDLGPGSIVCLSDHLNMLGASPLRGPNDDRLGPRFLDLSEVYAQSLRAIASEEASRLGLRFGSGVYACVPGPNYETPAEVQLLRKLGADVVGMSTVPEAIVARHGGLDVLALAIVSNWAAGISPTPLSHAEVLEASRAIESDLANLLESILKRIDAEDRSS